MSNDDAVIEGGHNEGETEEEYRKRISRVPGIFGESTASAFISHKPKSAPVEASVEQSVETEENREEIVQAEESAYKEKAEREAEAKKAKPTPVDDDPATPTFNEKTKEFVNVELEAEKSKSAPKSTKPKTPRKRTPKSKS